MSLRETTIPDVNVLVYAINRDAGHHQRAFEWLTAALSGGGTVGFTWQVLLGFIRICTHPSILERPLDTAAAVRQVENWLGAENAILVEPGERHFSLLRDLLTRKGVAGSFTADAHIAVVAIEHEAKLASFDSDFHSLPELRFEFLGALGPA